MKSLFPRGIRGLADSKWSGQQGSVAEMVGIDIHSKPGIVTVRQKMTKESDPNAPTELCKVAITARDGSQLWFSSESGKIWRRTSAGNWSLVYTTAPTTGAADCKDAAHFDGYIYWTTERWLFRVFAEDVDTFSNAEQWQELTGTDANTRFAGPGTTSNQQGSPSVGDVAWQNTDNAKNSDDVYTQASLLAGQTTNYLLVHNFGFRIPNNATIIGVEVKIEKKQSGLQTGTIEDLVVSLTDSANGNPSTGGQNKALSGAWPTTDQVFSYGGQNDTWGLNLTPAIINSSAFGVTIRAQNTHATDQNTAFIDQVTMRVYYREPETEFHPMRVQNLSLFIGDGSVVSEVRTSDEAGNHTFVPASLKIPKPHRVKTMIPYDIDLLIGTIIDDSTPLAQIIRWDTVSPSWSSDDFIEEAGVNAFIRDDNYVYAQCGKYGRLYFYNGAVLQPFKRIPGNWSPTKKAVIHPNATATYFTLPVFGVSNESGDPCLQGIYTLGSYSREYPKVLDLSYPVSSGATSGVTIGAVLVVGTDLFVSFSDGTNKGVDKIDHTAKQANAYIETKMLNIGGRMVSVKQLAAQYASLPANTGVSFKVKRYSDDSLPANPLKSVTDIIRRAIFGRESTPNAPNPQIRIDFTVSGNDAPEVEDFLIDAEAQEL